MTFSVDSSSTSVCSAGTSKNNQATITILSAGMCTVDANQAKGNGYAAAPQVFENFTVNQTPLTITAENRGVAYGGKMPGFSWSANFVSGDTASSLSTQPACTTTATADSHGNDTSPPGTYDITCVGAADADYSPITYAKGTLTVSKSPVVLTYTGPKTAKVGSTITLSAKMTSLAGNPIAGKAITFDLFPLRGSSQQICHATTSAAGAAGCKITNVHHWTKIRWARMIFAGDKDYPANTTNGVVTVHP